MNPIEYLVKMGFRITSDPTKYRAYYPDGPLNPWGKRDYWERHNGKIIYYDSFCGGYHRAYDLSKHEGAALPAVVDGIIGVGTSAKGNFGGTVVLYDKKKDYQYIYGHVKNIQVNVGDEVKQGQKLAEQSSTNYYNNPMSSHLHFQVQTYGYRDEKGFVCDGIDPRNININDYVEGGNKMSRPLVVVDVGHDPNAFPPSKGVYKNGKGYEEYDFNKKLADKLIPLLKHNGFDVITNQTYWNLTQRTNYYDSKRPDLGISLHANAGAANAGGRCAFYWVTSTQGKKFANSIVGNMKKMGYGLHGSGLHASQFGSWTNLHMVRECTTFPMVLVEHGFMTNSLDFPLIFGDRQDEYTDHMAECEARAFCEYFGKKFSKPGSKPKPTAPAKPTTGKQLHRVQVGAFSKAANARTLEAAVKKKGYSTFLAYDTDDELYRVQVGAFSVKKNAENLQAKLKKDGYKDAFIAKNDGHVVSDGEADANETVAPKEKQTPRLIGEWKTNKHGTQYIKAEGTFTVGGSRIMSRFGSPFLSAPEGGFANPGWSCDYVEMMRQDGHIWVGYYVGGKYKTIPIRTWDPVSGNVGPLWGTLT